MPIRYEGRYPDGDNSLVTKKWTDDTATASAVTTTFITNEISRVVSESTLQTITYVDSQDALLAKLADVTAADTLYLNTSARNATVAGLDGSGMLISGQIPTTVVTDRLARSHVGTASFSGNYTCNTTLTREKKLASVTIPDPGFPYIVLPFGSVTGQAGGTPGVYPWSGNGVCGLLTVCPPAGSGDTIYGLGAATDSPVSTSYPIFPYAASGATPANRPALNGATTLDLYGSCFQGSGYTFYSAGLSFYVIVIPTL